MDLLEYVMNPFNEFGGFVGFILNMGRLCLCGCKGKFYINGAQWLKSDAHLKTDVVGDAMEGSVVDMLNIRKDHIPCVWILGVLHAQDMHYHPISDLCLVSINLAVEGSGFGELGVQ
jgi:hypothetical protein